MTSSIRINYSIPSSCLGGGRNTPLERPIQTWVSAHYSSRFPTGKANANADDPFALTCQPAWSILLLTASVGNLDIAAANAAGASCQPDQPRSPLSDQDRARLEHSLGHRPDRQELEEKNILKPGNLAPALQARRDELQKSQLADKLEGRLERRPEKDELVIRGILKDQSVAPSLQAKRDELQKHQLTHKLEARLERRPEKDQLVNRGILKHQSVAPALQAKKEELERARLGNQLQKELQQRPDVDELKQKGILTDPEDK